MLQLDRLLDELSKLEASKQLVPVLVFLCLDYAVPGVVDEAQYVTLFLLRYLKVGQCRLEMRLVGCPEQSTSGTNGQYTLLFSRFNISVSGKHNNNKPLYFYSFTALVSKPETQSSGRKKNQATTYLWSGR